MVSSWASASRESLRKVYGPMSTGFVSMPSDFASKYSSNGFVPLSRTSVEESNSGTR